MPKYNFVIHPGKNVNSWSLAQTEKANILRTHQGCSRRYAHTREACVPRRQVRV